MLSFITVSACLSVSKIPSRRMQSHISFFKVIHISHAIQSYMIFFYSNSVCVEQDGLVVKAPAFGSEGPRHPDPLDYRGPTSLWGKSIRSLMAQRSEWVRGSIPGSNSLYCNCSAVIVVAQTVTCNLLKFNLTVYHPVLQMRR